MHTPRSMISFGLILALLALAQCAGPQQPPPEDPGGPAPATAPQAAPAETPARPPAPPARDPSRPPPEVEAGCLPECTWVAGKCQALVDPGPAFGGEEGAEDEKEKEEEIGPGQKREKLVRPCKPHCCREQPKE